MKWRGLGILCFGEMGWSLPLPVNRKKECDFRYYHYRDLITSLNSPAAHRTKARPLHHLGSFLLVTYPQGSFLITALISSHTLAPEDVLLIYLFIFGQVCALASILLPGSSHSPVSSGPGRGGRIEEMENGWRQGSLVQGAQFILVKVSGAPLSLRAPLLAGVEGDTSVGLGR